MMILVASTLGYKTILIYSYNNQIVKVLTYDKMKITYMVVCLQKLY
jgi:hypothetical protein